MDYATYEQSCSMEGNENRSNLIINYLPQTVNDKKLFDIFSVIGPLKTCRVIKDFKTGYSYGFGFVDYENPDDAAKAIGKLNNLSLEHKTIKVSYARPPGDDIKETNLYIQNIPRNYGLEEFENLFSQFGTILQKNLLRDKLSGQPKGVGFIRFNKKTEADAAIAAMNGQIPEGGVQPLNVRIAEEHGKKKAEYSVGYYPGPSNFQGNFTGKIRPYTRAPPQSYGGMQGPPQYQSRGNYNHMSGKQPNRNQRRYNPLGNTFGQGMPTDYRFSTQLPSEAFHPY